MDLVGDAGLAIGGEPVGVVVPQGHPGQRPAAALEQFTDAAEFLVTAGPSEVEEPEVTERQDREHQPDDRTAEPVNEGGHEPLGQLNDERHGERDQHVRELQQQVPDRGPAQVSLDKPEDCVRGNDRCGEDCGGFRHGPGGVGTGTGLETITVQEQQDRDGSRKQGCGQDVNQQEPNGIFQTGGGQEFHELDQNYGGEDRVDHQGRPHRQPAPAAQTFGAEQQQQQRNQGQDHGPGAVDAHGVLQGDAPCVAAAQFGHFVGVGAVLQRERPDGGQRPQSEVAGQ
ncbi:hypothetical protein PJL18_00599 [Paenarthrobacter nicotinovorans]|nr:hypothetical protein [Paenarthrobacter nicotinovorans]